MIEILKLLQDAEASTEALAIAKGLYYLPPSRKDEKELANRLKRWYYNKYFK